ILSLLPKIIRSDFHSIPIIYTSFQFFLFHILYHIFIFFFFFNDPATTEIYTLSLHDALRSIFSEGNPCLDGSGPAVFSSRALSLDRKSTRLNSSHVAISYAVFCLKKKSSSIVGVRTIQVAWRHVLVKASMTRPSPQSSSSPV